MFSKVQHNFSVLTALLLFFIGLTPPLMAQTTKRVLILPVSINAQENLDYLQNGIRDMLASRLIIDDSVTVIGASETASALNEVRDPITDKTAVAIGRKLNADYVVLGSLTMFGGALSTDLRMIQTDSGEMVTTLSQTARDPGEIIGHVDGFAQRVNNEVFGRTAAQPTVPPVPTVTATPAVPQEDLRQHPDKLLEQAKQAPGLQSPGSGWVNTAPAAAQLAGSQYPFEILGLAVGDVTGDGRNEIVFIDDYNVYVANMQNGQLVQIAHLNYNDYNRFLRVAVADINANGRAEIFITNLPVGRNWLESFVLEFNGVQYATIAKADNWFYHVIQDPQGRPMLLGQKRGRTDDAIQFGETFDGKVQSLVWQNGRYRADHAVDLPPKISIYQFIFAPPGVTMGDLICFNDSNRLQIISQGGDIFWESSDKFGGGNVSQVIDTPDGSEKTMRLYFPNRILTADIDNDGRMEILTVKNNDAASSFMQWRSFKDGNIVALKWNGLAMEPIWLGRKVSKFIADLAYGDLDGDGRSEFVYAAIGKYGNKREKGISTIVVEQPQSPK